MIVTVVPYNPDWPQAFEREAAQIKKLLGANVVAIYHIGSTAVPGLMAKPIIDMILEVSALGTLDAQSLLMEHIGYEALGENGIPRRRYFRKGGDQRTHQIHAFASGDPHIGRHLAFRDYLIAHKEVADAYGKLKWEIAQSCNHDIEQYCDEKDPFVKEHEQKALGWYNEKL